MRVTSRAHAGDGPCAIFFTLDSYHADPEHNRIQDGRVKLILDERYEEVSITCDLILHSRGVIVERDNLIAIEMKKWDQPPAEKEKDRVHLRALTKAWGRRFSHQANAVGFVKTSCRA